MEFEASGLILRKVSGLL